MKNHNFAMENILNVENVSKCYSGHQALEDVTFDIPRGCVYGLLGPNGAGKTTLIRIINHITAPDAGQVLINGHRLTATDVTSIGYLPEERGLYKKMKVGEQAMFFARLKGLDKKEARKRLTEWFERFDITSWWDRKVEELSKGMAQKVQFIVTVLHRPELLIFDEPFSGFDPINANLLKEEILRLKEEGATIIFSTHNMSSVEEICDNITLINHGHNMLTGNVDALRSRYSAGRYRFSFTGDSAPLLRAIDGTGTITSRDTNPTTGVVTAEACFPPSSSARDIITMLNNAVDLVSFSPAIASMNDIFINTVNENIHE